MEDIRDLRNRTPLVNCHKNPDHPGHQYCWCSTGSKRDGDYRIHIAKNTDFKVLGSFPSIETAKATLNQLYLLEAAA
ncbi:MAG: hypothetical protein AAF773_04385 [Cyanobacteria bacterium P01_D01_bin.115]